MKPLHLISLAIMAIAAASSSASANADALTASSLVGVWAFDCAKPHSNANAYVTYSVKSGKPIERVQMGTTVDRTTEMSQLTFAGGKLTHGYMQDGEQMIVTLAIEAKRHRTWSSSSMVPFGAETFYIKDGVGQFGDHKSSEWFNRCS